MIITPRSIFEKLVDTANLPCYQNDQIKHCVRTGKPLPSHLGPGSLVMKLSPEERQILQSLTADMTFDRQY